MAKRLTIAITFCFLSLLILKCGCNGNFTMQKSEETGKSDSSGLTTVQTVLLSVGLLTGVVVCSFCTRLWWIRFCRALRGVEEPEAPSAVFDDRHRDSIFVEPPIFSVYHDTRTTFEMQETNVASITTSSDAAQGSAQDWFDTETSKNFNRTNVAYIAEMGKGWFGKVLKAQVRNANPFHEHVPAVVKELREGANYREQMRFLDEARFYRDESNENILRLLAYSIERPPYLLIFEYWPLGTLKDYLSTKYGSAPNPAILIRMAIDVAKGLEWMEQAGFVHGDLAARNCLVANTAGKVIIGDYGLSTQRFRQDYYWSSNTAIPIRWNAPECLHITMNTIITNRATSMSNVWAFGIVLWEIVELAMLPYPNLTDEQVLDQVIKGRTYLLERPKSQSVPESTNDKLYNIMLTCWNSDPTTRPRITTILDVLNSP